MLSTRPAIVNGDIGADASFVAVVAVDALPVQVAELPLMSPAMVLENVFAPFMV